MGRLGVGATVPKLIPQVKLAVAAAKTEAAPATPAAPAAPAAPAVPTIAIMTAAISLVAALEAPLRLVLATGNWSVKRVSRWCAY